MKYHLIALGWLGLSVSTFAAQTATQPLSTLTAGDVKPNIMFTIDDSGSMAWSHMPDTVANWRTGLAITIHYVMGCTTTPVPFI